MSCSSWSAAASLRSPRANSGSRSCTSSQRRYRRRLTSREPSELAQLAVVGLALLPAGGDGGDRPPPGTSDAVTVSSVGRRCGPSSVTLTMHKRAACGLRCRASRAARRSRDAASARTRWPCTRPTGWVGVPGGGRWASMTHSPCSRCSSSTPSSRDLAVPVGAQRDYPGRVPARRRRAGLAVGDRVRPRAVDVHVVARGVQVPGPTPGGRQPISENFSPFGPKNHSMCVADVPIPRAAMTRAPSRAARRTPARCRSGWWR
jgi:hypothetical protein